MSDTPRTNACIRFRVVDPVTGEEGALEAVSIDFARQLERELTVAQGLEQMAYDQRDRAFEQLASRPEVASLRQVGQVLHAMANDGKSGHVVCMMFCGKPARTISTPNDTPAHEKAFLDSLDAAGERSSKEKP